MKRLSVANLRHSSTVYTDCYDVLSTSAGITVTLALHRQVPWLIALVIFKGKTKNETQYLVIFRCRSSYASFCNVIQCQLTREILLSHILHAHTCANCTWIKLKSPETHTVYYYFSSYYYSDESDPSSKGTCLSTR